MELISKEKQRLLFWEESCITEKNPRYVIYLKTLLSPLEMDLLKRCMREQVLIPVEQPLYERQQRLHRKDPETHSFSLVWEHYAEFWKFSLKAKNQAVTTGILAGKSWGSSGYTRQAAVGFWGLLAQGNALGYTTTGITRLCLPPPSAFRCL